MNNQNTKLGTVIVTYNGEKHINKLLASLPSLENTIIVDNDSKDKTTKIAEKFGCKIIKNTKNLGYGAAVNQGLKSLKNKYTHFLILNQDTIIKSFDLTEKDLESSDIIQAQVLLPNGKINVESLSMNIFGFIYPKNYNNFSIINSPKKLEFFSGSSFIISQNVINDIGYFDESLFLYYEDADYSIRCLMKGKKMVLMPKFKVEHSYHNLIESEDKKQFIYKNRKVIINRYFKDIWRKLLFIKKIKPDKYTLSKDDKNKFASTIKTHLLLGFFTTQLPLATRIAVNTIMVPYSFFIKLFL
ncbi:MAG: glycosyltransferase family 2 protein [Candidatus Gracilibacteria bacterium]